MDTATATRPIMWNISHPWVMYLLLVISLGIAAYGLYRRVNLWRRGLPANRFDRPVERLMRLFRDAAGQRKTLQDKYAAVFHTMIYTGFIILTIATTVVALDYDFHTSIMHGNFYLYFQSFTVDIFGMLTIIGILIAAYRRLITKPEKLVYTDEATQILAVILVISVTGFLLEGWRIAATNDPWAAWSPFGNLVAKISAPMGESLLKTAHLFTWWFHAVLVFGFIAWAPFTKMAHVIMAPLNIYTSSLEPIGANLKFIDIDKAMESGDKFGVNSLAGFTWKDLADFDACTECGRCTDACPAHRVGKELSPRDIILQLQGLTKSAIQHPQSAFDTPIIGAVPATATEALWQCTTCAACVEACPVYIEQFPKIVDMRRFLVMEEAEFPDTMQDAITSLESRGHPFKGTQATRTDWTEGLTVRSISEARDAEVILWVGCGGALIERNQKVTRAIAELLTQAKVNFAILGREEKCTGDPARRIGNEFLFETLAKENTEKLNGYGVKKIITSCPHCFNTFRNEYPQYGGHYEVFHHSEYLAKLVDEGKLAPTTKLDKKITFHDPCYLGRHNGVFDAPRQLVQISGRTGVTEVAQSRKDSFCCGGGGGMSFVDEPKDKRVNQERATQLLATGADIVAVGCPFCTTMMEDGLNAKKGDRDVQVMDVAEILLQAMK